MRHARWAILWARSFSLLGQFQAPVWTFILGGIMTVLAVISILTTGVSGEIIGTFVMWVIALPFWAVYLANRRNWWAIIPSGVMVVIGLMPLLSLS